MEKMQESINKNLEELKNKHTETKNTITEIKNTLEGINSRISEAKEWISELEDKMVEITSEEQNKVKRKKRTEDGLRNLWDNIKRTNIWIIGVPEEEEKRKGYEKIFEEIIVENFPNMEKEIVNQGQETQSLIDLSDNIKCTNILITWLQEEEEKRKGMRKILKRLWLKISPTWKMN